MSLRHLRHHQDNIHSQYAISLNKPRIPYLPCQTQELENTVNPPPNDLSFLPLAFCFIPYALPHSLGPSFLYMIFFIPLLCYNSKVNVSLVH